MHLYARINLTSFIHAMTTKNCFRLLARCGAKSSAISNLGYQVAYSLAGTHVAFALSRGYAYCMPNNLKGIIVLVHFIFSDSSVKIHDDEDTEV